MRYTNRGLSWSLCVAVALLFIITTTAVGAASPVEKPTLNPATDPTNNKRPTLIWQSVENAFKYRVEIARADDFSPNSMVDNTIRTDTSYSPQSNLPDGRIYWRVVAIDNENNESPSDSDDFIIDTVGPVVTITTPITIGEIDNEDKASVTVEGTAVDDLTGIQTIEYRVDGDQWLPADSQGSFTFTTDNLDGGTHTIDVRAKDSANNLSHAATVQAIVAPTPSVSGESPFMFILGAGAVFFISGIAIGWKAFGGRGGRIVEPVGLKPRVRDSEAGAAIRGADDDVGRAGNALKEASKHNVDVSAEQEMLKKTQEFDNMARKEYRDGRYDSAYAYASATSALGSGIASALKAKLEEARAAAGARQKAKADIRVAEAAMEEVKSEIGEAKSAGIDAKPATSLADLAAEIMKMAKAAKDPETYRFQSATARQIAEHAAASLKGSIAGQKDQVKRTDEAIAGAKDALSKAGARIGKERKNFDTLVPEYWLKVAREVFSIAEDKKLGAEVREAMADTSTRICEWIGDMFERRDIRVRMKKGKGITLR